MQEPFKSFFALLLAPIMPSDHVAAVVAIVIVVVGITKIVEEFVSLFVTF